MLVKVNEGFRAIRGSFLMAVSAAQTRAARALIDMTQEELASAAGVATKTIASFESEGRAPRGATLAKLQVALEEAGVVFIETKVGSGVLLRLGSDSSAA